MQLAVHHILRFLHEWAPPKTKFDYDNVGLLVGGNDQPVARILTCLDVTEALVDEAINRSADLIVAHHPLIFKGLKQITRDTEKGRTLFKLIQNDISVIAAHTNLDAARYGVSWKLAEKLQLNEIEFLDESEDFEDTGMGAVGVYKEPVSREAFLSMLCKHLNTDAVRFSGSPAQIQKVAVCGGAGVFLNDKALKIQADAFVTADIKYHNYFLEDKKFLLVDVGHYESEIPIVEDLQTNIAKEFEDAAVFTANTNTNPMQIFSSQNPVNPKPQK